MPGAFDIGFAPRQVAPRTREPGFYVASAGYSVEQFLGVPESKDGFFERLRGQRCFKRFELAADCGQCIGPPDNFNRLGDGLICLVDGAPILNARLLCRIRQRDIAFALFLPVRGQGGTQGIRLPVELGNV